MSSQPEAGQTGPTRSGRALAARLRRPPGYRPLARLPTPVERAPWLDGPHGEGWIKRDDLSSPVYGGGKVRKLEWVLGNAPYDGDEAILSVGGTGSHHLLALALFLRDQERHLHALTFEQAPTAHVRRNLAVLVSTGARLWRVRSRPRLPLAWLAYNTWQRPGRRGIYMDAGASTALGCFGFVEAGLELAEQIEAGHCPRPSTIFVTAGSAGTSAGLALGLALAGVSTHLHLVSSVEPLVFNRVLYHRKLAQALGALRRAGLDAPRSVRRMLARGPVTYTIDHTQVGPGYGAPTPAARDAVRVAAEHGIHLETTYTAKCMSALLADARRRGPFLFWHTHAANDLTPYIVDDWEQRVPELIDV